MDLGKKRQGWADLHNPIHPLLYTYTVCNMSPSHSKSEYTVLYLSKAVVKLRGRDIPYHLDITLNRPQALQFKQYRGLYN